METKSFTLEQLKQYDGKAGKSAYVAYQGKVYDVSGSNLWTGGDHEGYHYAGNDLTADMENAPHGDESFEGFPVVGELKP